MKNKKTRFSNINNTDAIALIILKMMIVELLLIILWQSAIYYLQSNGMSLIDNPYSKQKSVHVDDVDITRKDRYLGEYGYMIISGDDEYLLYNGRDLLSVDIDTLVGKTIEIKYISKKYLFQDIDDRLFYPDSNVVIELREGDAVYEDINDVEQLRLQRERFYKGLISGVFIILSLVWLFYCDGKLEKHMYYLTPLWWMIYRLPLLFKWGKKRDEYRKFLEDDRIRHDKYIEKLKLAEKTRIEHKADEKFQKKVQRRKKRKRKMKKK